MLYQILRLTPQHGIVTHTLVREKANMRNLQKLCALVISLTCINLFFSSCSKPPAVEIATLPPSVQYVIGPEDVLVITVWKEPELTQTVPVRPDGKISLPLLNDVPAAGLTPLELQKDLTKKLSTYLESPTVSVTVSEINSLKIFVIGNVNTPGTVQVQQEVNLLQAISLAGGLNEWAKKSKLKIVRKDGAIEKTFYVNYNKILKGKEANIPIYPGDTIIVP